jgi:hypothetical protein
MGLSLVVASASWAGFIMSRTVLDPGRSERLADHLLDNEEVRATVTDRVADAIEARIPPEIPVPRETIELAAEAALDDPRVEAVVRDGIVQAHRNALEGNDAPVTLDATAIGAAARDAVVEQQPDLDPFLPAAPELTVELPSTGLSWLGTIKDLVDRFTTITAVISLIGMTTAFVLARNRPAALRRVAYWAFGASAFWILAAFGIPAVLERLAPSSAAIAMAAVDVFFGAMIPPALALAGAGVALIVVSLAYPAIARRQGGAMLDRAARQRSQPAQPARPTRPARGRPQPGRPVPTTPAGYPVGPVPQVGAGQGHPDDPTLTFPQIISNPRPPQPTPASQPPPGGSWPAETTVDWEAGGDERRPPEPVPGPGWVEGVGYVDEPTRRDEPTRGDEITTRRSPNDQ